MAIALCACSGSGEVGPDPVVTTSGIWISANELAELPVEGTAWDNLAAYADRDWGDADLGDQDSDHDVGTLAGALVASRLADAAMGKRVTLALEEVNGSTPENLLGIARNLQSYVIAADVIGYRRPSFDDWLIEVIDHEGTGRAGLRTVRQLALHDPTNHGSHARAAVLAVALYLDDDDLVDEIASRFHDWLGRSSSDFEWRDLSWQADPDTPSGINRPGGRIGTVEVDGVLPEEQRRSGSFTGSPPQEPYVWEALQGAVVTAELLNRTGRSATRWESNALRRAFEWLYEVNDFPATGDDTWQPWIINAAYDSAFPVSSPTRPGKNMGFTDWTHARSGRPQSSG